MKPHMILVVLVALLVGYVVAKKTALAIPYLS